MRSLRSVWFAGIWGVALLGAACASDGDSANPDASAEIGQSDAAVPEGGSLPDARAGDAQQLGCDTWTAPRLSGCAEWETPVGSAVSITGSIAGVVTEVVPRQWVCRNPINYVPSGSVGTAWTFRVSDGMQVLAVSVRVPWPTPLVQVGDSVRIESDVRTVYPVGIDGGHLTVRGDDGSLVFWLGRSSSLQGMTLPGELSLSVGPAVCQGEGFCGQIAHHDLVADMMGTRVDLPYGESVQVGDLIAVHGGEQSRVGAMSCPDWDPNDVVAALIRGSIDDLESGAGGPCGSGQCSGTEYCAADPASQCDVSSTSALCQSRPASCPNDCPGVCGCDGLFYCNDCLALSAGVDVSTDPTCMGAGCAPSSVTAAEGPAGCVTVVWSCYERDYQVSCQEDGSCECREDGEVVRTGTLENFGGCELLPPVCGFPFGP